MAKSKAYLQPFVLKLHPLKRVLISFILAFISIFITINWEHPLLFKLIISWSIFCVSYIIMCWTIMFKSDLEHIKNIAKSEDGSRVFVLVFTIFTAFVAMVSVLLLVISSTSEQKNNLVIVAACFISVMLSWVLVHTILTFHYAHLFYDEEKESFQSRGGLIFPNDEQPDYLDFAYFSFVIGMTFQVSDVNVTDKKMRRVVLLHGIISFVFNTFIVALTINFVAGLSK